MGNKNGYDPSIRRGVHQFSHAGVWFTVCYRGSVLEQFKFGDRVIFEGSVEGCSGWERLKGIVLY